MSNVVTPNPESASLSWLFIIPLFTPQFLWEGLLGKRFLGERLREPLKHGQGCLAAKDMQGSVLKTAASNE